MSGRINYLALIGDIQGSRDIPNRKAFQQTFHGLMEQLNREFGPQIVSPFTVTLGDEFQVLLGSADRLFELLGNLRTGLGQVSVFVGMGIGGLDTELFTHTSVGMDGPCFHLARRELEEAKKSPPRTRIGIHDLESRVLNSFLRFLEIMEARQTEHQKQVIRLYEKLGNQMAVAEQLQITQAAVSQALKSAHYQEIRQGREQFVAFLNQFLTH